MLAATKTYQLSDHDRWLGLTPERHMFRVMDISARLPQPGGDTDRWGEILNTFLGVSHNPDGSLQSAALAAAGAVQSVNNHTGPTVQLNKQDIGLGSVDNTADADKPVSSAVASAIAASATPLASVSVPGKSRQQVYNVRDYGAAGDGARDDTGAITAAMNAASGGGTVFFPQGTYLVSDSIAVPSNCIVAGTGRASILKAKAGDYAFAAGPNLLDVHARAHVVIKDLAFDGNAANITYAGKHNVLYGQDGITYANLQGIMVYASDDVTITNCYIHHTYSSGVMAQGSTNLNFGVLRLDHCGDNQIYVRAIDNPPYTQSSNVIIHAVIADSGAFSGIQTLAANNVSITNCVTSNNGGLPESAGQGDGVGCEGGTNIVISGIVTFNNGIQGIQLRETEEVGVPHYGVSHAVIANVESYGHASGDGDSGGIAISDADDVVISDVNLHDNFYGINVNQQTIGVTNLRISNTHISNSSSVGMRLAPGNQSIFVIDGIVITGSGGDAMYCNVKALIRSAVMTGATYQGVTLDTGADGTRFENCDFFDNGDNGIDNTQAANIEIAYCRFTNTTGQQSRAYHEAAGKGPTTLYFCQIDRQRVEPYFFSHPNSVNYSEAMLVQKAGDTLSGSLFVDADNTFMGADATAVPRLGFMKRAGIGPRLAHGNGESLIIVRNTVENTISPADTYTDELIIDTSGNVTIAAGTLSMNSHAISGVAEPTDPADVATKHYVDTAGWVTVPPTAASSGIAGQKAYDGSYLYVCVADNTWKRVSIATF